MLNRLFCSSWKCGSKTTTCFRLFCGLLTTTSLVCNILLLLTLHKSNNGYNFDSTWSARSVENLFFGIDSSRHSTSTADQPQRSSSLLYLAFDEAAPRIVYAKSHHLPNAVPSHRVIPQSQAENETYHIEKRTNTSSNSIEGQKGTKRPFYNDSPASGHYDWANHNYNSDHRALYLYNPSVLPLVVENNNNIPMLLSHDLIEAITGGDPSVAYLATFRANTGGNCFGSDRVALMKAGEQISYLAIALLNRKLDVVTGTDVLIDLNAGPSFVKYFQQSQEDCKVVAIAGHIHFLCNEQLLRVSVVRRDKPYHNQIINPAINSNLHTGNDTRVPYRYPNIYGTGLEITLLSRRKIAGGKNFNIFHVPRTDAAADNTLNDKDYYLQTWPLPHHYHKLRIPQDYASNPLLAKISIEAEQQSKTSLPHPAFDGPDTAHVITTCRENEKPGTWIANCTGESKQVKPFFDDKDHGTSCCITMTLPLSLRHQSSNRHSGVMDDVGTNETVVLVGISHTKTTAINNPWWLRDIHNRYRTNVTVGAKRYLSRFVAYQSHPPFDIVGRSGWFCLGFADIDEPGGGNTLAGRNQQYRLDLFSSTGYRCPMIHFASGISEYVGNSSKAIISYGVADCHPRMIVVEKQDIAQRLLGIG